MAIGGTSFVTDEAVHHGGRNGAATTVCGTRDQAAYRQENRIQDTGRGIASAQTAEFRCLTRRL
jgi:hypothetical protein